jgi:hypothetical protein
MVRAVGVCDSQRSRKTLITNKRIVIITVGLLDSNSIIEFDISISAICMATNEADRGAALLGAKGARRLEVAGDGV